jgi:hypothetical protein
MIAVIFEVYPESNHKQDYCDIAGSLSSDLREVDGFILIERFQNLIDPEKIGLSPSGVTNELSKNGEISKSIISSSHQTKWDSKPSAP